MQRRTVDLPSKGVMGMARKATSAYIHAAPFEAAGPLPRQRPLLRQSRPTLPGVAISLLVGSPLAVPVVGTAAFLAEALPHAVKHQAEEAIELARVDVTFNDDIVEAKQVA